MANEISKVIQEADVYEEVDFLHVGPQKFGDLYFIEKVVSMITSKGLDVEPSYLEHVKDISSARSNVKIKFYPYYHLTFDANVHWIDKSGNQKEKVETLTFECFLEEDNPKSIYHSLIKNALKEKEAFSSSSYKSVQLAIMEDKLMKNSALYDRAHKMVKESKNYRKVEKINEKSSDIFNVRMEIFLVPIATLTIGECTQILNMMTGEILIDYVKNHVVTETLNKVKIRKYTAAVSLLLSTGLVFILAFLFRNKNNQGTVEVGVFNSIYQVLPLICLLVGMLALGISVTIGRNRSNVVHYLEKEKNLLSKLQTYIWIAWFAVAVNITTFVIFLFEVLIA